MAFSRDRSWPRWTAGPGSGGSYKLHPEDFVVDELPLRRPDGAGEHLWLRVEKIGRTTPEVAEILAAAAGVRREAVGYAGLKDRAARTIQVFTIMGATALGELPPDVRVVEEGRTRHKIRIGQLRGNRFRIVVTGGDARVAAARAARLAQSGLPNYYGAQRLSHEAPDRGRALLTGELAPGGIEETRFALSAWQARLFNVVLAERGSRLLPGDLLDDEVPTGPMYGWSMPWPSGGALELEEEVLFAEHLPEGALRRFPELTRGARRPLWVTVAPRVTPCDGGFVVELTLPPGSYASVALEEIL